MKIAARAEGRAAGTPARGRMWERLRRTATLLQVSEALGATIDLSGATRRALQLTVRSIGAEMAGVWLRTAAGERFQPLAVYPASCPPVAEAGQARLAADHPLLRELARGPVILPDSHDEPWLAVLGLDVVPARTVLLQPLLVAGTLEGVLLVGWPREADALAPSRRELVAGVSRLIAGAFERHREQARVAEEERLRCLALMARSMAHDFNNALAPIIGYSELLLEARARGTLGRDPEVLARRLQAIHTSATDSAAVVRRMREFCRPRAAGDVLGVLDLAELAERVRSSTERKWRDEALAKGRSIVFALDCEPLLTVTGSEPEVVEALTSLVCNAIEAMPDGGTLTVRTRLEGRTAPASVSIAVSDTGVGMNEETRRRCLEPFFSTKGHRQGTGLGLAVVLGTVRRHGGTIDVESVEGRGTTMIIRIPVGAPALAEPRTTPATLSRPLRVLVVDDEPPLLAMLGAYLAQDGHAVETAADGRTALDRLSATRFDLVVTDRVMPGMSGDQLASLVKETRPDLPVIMLTGVGDIMVACHDRPHGVDVVVGKPVTLARFREALVTAAGPR